MTLEHPEYGGRVRLDLSSQDGPRAVYGVTLLTDDARWEGEALLDPEHQEPKLGALHGPGDAPAWLVRYARAMLSSILRDKREDVEARWPRRVLRWRNER